MVITILLETVGATAADLSAGFTRPLFVALTLTATLAAYYTLALTLKRGMGVGIAYGLWTALGVALVAIIGVVLLGDQLSTVQVGGLILVMIGVLGMELGRAEEPTSAHVPDGATADDRAD